MTSSQGEVRSEPVEKLDRVDFSLSTGTVVPSYARIRPLPKRIVEIVPQYRGYDFVMVRDEIVIIEPRTRRIVTILQGEGVLPSMLRADVCGSRANNSRSSGATLRAKDLRHTLRSGSATACPRTSRSCPCPPRS